MKTCRRCGTDRLSSDYYPKYAVCKPCVSEKMRANHADGGRERSRVRRNKRLYGLDQKAFVSILEAQRFKCAICSADIDLISDRQYAVDHNHETGEARGILCNTCNRAIGLLKDNPVLLNKAADYLTERGHYG